MTLKMYSSKARHDTLKQYHEYMCAVCGLPDLWNNQPLRLQVDHIDGDSRNNALENLRFICPNCHSQTDNFTGRNKKKVEMRNRPSKEEFLDLFKTHSLKEISILKGVAPRLPYV